jgi:microcystin-dependent protein
VSGKTAAHELPYPETLDAPAGPAQIKALAEAVEAALTAVVPPGTMLGTARATAPTGFLLCDGSAVSRTTFAALFAAISTTYGSGNGSTTFNLPDLRGRTLVGVDGAANRLTALDTLGAAGGEQLHTLLASEMPSHTHPAGSLFTSIAVNESFQVFGNASGSSSFAEGFKAIPNWGNVSNAIGGSTAAAGSGGSHNVMQPYQVGNYMIKT